MRAWFAEALGTAILVFAGTGAIIINDVSNGAITHPGIALTFGLVVMALIYSLGHISGAHLNPAVTLGLWSAGRTPAREIPPYLLAQCLGAILASAALRLLFPEHPTLGATLPAGSVLQSFLLEFLLTAFLMLVILSTTGGPVVQRPFAGLAIGAVIALEAMFAGPICGASMNPARSLGPALISGQRQHLWAYLVAPIAGALVGTLVAGLLRDPSSNSSEAAA